MTEKNVYDPHCPGGPHQGSVYRDIRVATFLPAEGRLDLQAVLLQYAVILTQECDLDQDKRNRTEFCEAESSNTGKTVNHDKYLPTVLVCPCYPAAVFQEGNHLSMLDLTMRRIPGKEIAKIRSNLQLRYHCLSGCTELSVPELIVDFKHMITVSTEVMRTRYNSADHHIARLRCPYREDLSQRFAAFLSRVGLPVEHHLIDSASGSEVSGGTQPH